MNIESTQPTQSSPFAPPFHFLVVVLFCVLPPTHELSQCTIIL